MAKKISNIEHRIMNDEVKKTVVVARGRMGRVSDESREEEGEVAGCWVLGAG